MRLKSSITSCLIFFFVSFACFAQDKIVFFNIDHILNNSIVGKKIKKDLDLINKKNIKELEAKKKIIENNEKKLINKKNLINESEFRKEALLLEEEIKNFRLFKDKITNDFIEMKQKRILDFMNSINPIIENYIQKNQISMVLDKKSVYISKLNHDITSELLDIINKEIKE